MTVPCMTPDSTRREGVRVQPIRLHDGQYWGFALPVRLLRPKTFVVTDRFGQRVEETSIEIIWAHPLSTRLRIQHFAEACEREAVATQYENFLAIAFDLLMRAHDIDLTKARALLTFREADFPDFVSSVMDVILASSICVQQAESEKSPKT